MLQLGRFIKPVGVGESDEQTVAEKKNEEPAQHHISGKQNFTTPYFNSASHMGSLQIMYQSLAHTHATLEARYDVLTNLLRPGYCARLAVIGASINGAFFYAAHCVSTTFTALGVPAAASRLTATLGFYCSNAAHWTANSVSLCRNVLAERFVGFTNTSNSAA
ncbi:unnamed protein product [Zymoseptoria tritici ST99CH_3D1]|nr:unnamed protein product [Zymoseptoria tritici ST99CH_3D1]